MKRSHKAFWCRLAIGALTLPLLQMSCVEVAQRAVINGFLDAATELVDQQLGQCLTEAWEANEGP